MSFGVNNNNNTPTNWTAGGWGTQQQQLDEKSNNTNDTTTTTSTAGWGSNTNNNKNNAKSSWTPGGWGTTSTTATTTSSSNNESKTNNTSTSATTTNWTPGGWGQPQQQSHTSSSTTNWSPGGWGQQQQQSGGGGASSASNNNNNTSWGSTNTNNSNHASWGANNNDNNNASAATDRVPQFMSVLNKNITVTYAKYDPDNGVFGFRDEFDSRWNPSSSSSSVSIRATWAGDRKSLPVSGTTHQTLVGKALYEHGHCATVATVACSSPNFRNSSLGPNLLSLIPIDENTLWMFCSLFFPYWAGNSWKYCSGKNIDELEEEENQKHIGEERHATLTMKNTTLQFTHTLAFSGASDEKDVFLTSTRKSLVTLLIKKTPYFLHSLTTLNFDAVDRFLLQNFFKDDDNTTQEDVSIMPNNNITSLTYTHGSGYHDANDIKLIRRYFPNLTCLDFEDTIMTWTAVKHLLDNNAPVQTHFSSSSSSSNTPKTFLNPKNLRELCLSRCFLAHEEEFLSEIAKMCEDSRNLASLKLACVPTITSQTLPLLSSSPGLLDSLIELDLQNNNRITAIDVVRHIGLKFLNLRSLNLSGCGQIREQDFIFLMMGNTNKKGSGGGDHDDEDGDEGKGKWRRMDGTSLAFHATDSSSVNSHRGDPLSNDELSILFSSLRCLDVSWNGDSITDDFLKNFVSRVPSFSVNLRELKVPGCLVTKRGILDLSDAFPNLKISSDYFS